MSENDINKKALWYAVFTYKRNEERVRDYINNLAKTEKYAGLIIKAEVLINKKTLTVNGKIKQVEEKTFPDYVFIKAIMTPEVASTLRRVNGVAHFVGGSNMPEPITTGEARRVGISDIPGENFKTGDSVMAVDGPFENIVGKITKINKNSIKVSLSMFGREIETEFYPEQITKIY